MKTIFGKLPIILFVASLCFFSSLIGMAIWGKKLFPYEYIARALKEVHVLLPETVLDKVGKSKEQIERERRPSFLNKTRYTSPGTTVHKADAVAPGATLLTGHWPEYEWSAGLRLIDTEGNLLHHWNVDSKKIWPLKLFLDVNVHGSYLFPNGDVLFNIEYQGLVRLDACGEVIWKTDAKMKTHHSLFRAENGNFWVAGYKRIEKDNPRRALFPAIRAPFGEESLIEISPDGEVINEISLLEAVYNSDYRHLLWHYQRLSNPQTFDILHLNDVELLGRDLADEFPLFDEGDILVSSRALSVVAVLSPAGDIKWLKAGEFTHQHDPDFEQGGWISVFDNRTDQTSYTGENLGGSRIRAINPVTDEIRDLYPEKTQTMLFYTAAAGKHQLLDNGNRLITEAQAGRVFEVSPEGELVWEWIDQPYDEKYVPEVLEGTRYPNISESDVRQWSCQ